MSTTINRMLWYAVVLLVVAIAMLIVVMRKQDEQRQTPPPQAPQPVECFCKCEVDLPPVPLRPEPEL